LAVDLQIRRLALPAWLHHDLRADLLGCGPRGSTAELQALAHATDPAGVSQAS
jgi:hypothetical protein